MDREIKRQEVLRFIISFKAAHDGNSPTYREIMADCDLASTSLVAYYLAELEDRGQIRRPGVGRSRGIEVTGGRWSPPRAGRVNIAGYVDFDGK